MILGDIQTKTEFANATRAAATSLMQFLERLTDLQETYLARGYNPGAADAIADGDISASKITANQLRDVLESAWLVTRLNTLMNEGTVSGTIAGKSIMDKIRADM
jgi:hypothetical protein